MASRPASHRRLFVVVVPILSALATIGLIELSLIVFHPIPFSIERNMYFEADQYTGYRLKPNSRGYSGNGIPANINANGHRDAETTIARRPGVFRILVLGDSFTVGAHVREQEAYPKVLYNNTTHWTAAGHALAAAILAGQLLHGWPPVVNPNAKGAAPSGTAPWIRP